MYLRGFLNLWASNYLCVYNIEIKSSFLKSISLINFPIQWYLYILNLFYISMILNKCFIQWFRFDVTIRSQKIIVKTLIQHFVAMTFIASFFYFLIFFSSSGFSLPFICWEIFSMFFIVLFRRTWKVLNHGFQENGFTQSEKKCPKRLVM